MNIILSLYNNAELLNFFFKKKTIKIIFYA